MAASTNLLSALRDLRIQIGLHGVWTPDLIAWACAQLAAGEDSPALRRLAGLREGDPASESQVWLERLLAEQGGPTSLLPTDPELGQYAVQVAQRICRGERAPLLGLDELVALQQLRHQSDPLLEPLLDLHAALELERAEPGCGVILYPELSPQPETDVQAECALYLAWQEQPLPPGGLHALWCPDCQQFSPPPLQPAWAQPTSWLKRLLRRVMPGLNRGGTTPPGPICGACGSPGPLSLQRRAGRSSALQRVRLP
ncbi:MAG: hypothetical protein ACO1RX_19120 [Candidatus Sericytochromatia bacterium]